MLHIPVLRFGEPYRSVDVARAPHFRNREPFVEISQANTGLIRRDLIRMADARRTLARVPTAELIRACRAAAEVFLNGTLPLGETRQTPQEYVEQLSATTGLPWALVRRNMSKIAGVLASMEDVLHGLTRGLDLAALDEGWAPGNPPMSYFRRTEALGVVLPSNSPGVHSLWIPAIALKTPVVLKPGGAEPWTPYRVIQALIECGVPREAFGYYPCDHAGAAEILRSCGRGMIFGDATTMRAYANDPRIELHGPGFSKVVLGEDTADRWEEYLDVMTASIADNSGRSCVNASGIWTPRHGREIAGALAKKLAAIMPRPADDPEAALAPFADPSVARRIDAGITSGLQEPGATDVMARDRVVEVDGATYLLPAIIHCATAEHPLANREYLFPFAAVVECPHEELAQRIGPSLVVTALTRDSRLRAELLDSPHVGRLNFGPIATNHIAWDQPHEGNLFEHLYGRRAFQQAV